MANKILSKIKSIFKTIWYMTGLAFIVGLAIRIKGKNKVLPIKKEKVKSKNTVTKKNISEAEKAEQALKEFELERKR